MALLAIEGALALGSALSGGVAAAEGIAAIDGMVVGGSSLVEGLKDIASFGSSAIKFVGDIVESIPKELKMIANGAIWLGKLFGGNKDKKQKQSNNPRFGDGKSTIKGEDEGKWFSENQKRRKLIQQSILDEPLKRYIRSVPHNGFVQHPIHTGNIRGFDMVGRKRNPFHRGSEHLLPNHTSGLRSHISFAGDETIGVGIQSEAPYTRRRTS